MAHLKQQLRGSHAKIQNNKKKKEKMQEENRNNGFYLEM